MTCANCQHIKRHQQASMAMYRMGFCGCALAPHYVYFSRMYERECGDFVQKVAA